MKVFSHSMFVADSESGQTDFDYELKAVTTLLDILEAVTQKDRRVLSTMIDETGRFRPHVAVFFGSDQQLKLERPDISVGEEIEQISIFPALSGG